MGSAWPPALQWTDRRAIGTVYLASSPSGQPSVGGGYPNNPRRYFNDGNAADFDVRTVSGLAHFQTRILQQAEANVQNLTQLNARPIAGQTVSGTITITAQILNVTLDAAGSYLLVDGNEIGTARVSSSPYTYSLNTGNLANGMHTLQIRAHDTSNNTLLSNPIVVTTSNTKPPVVYPISLTYPTAGQSVSRTTSALGAITQTLDAAGSYLMLDGQDVGTTRITNPSYTYPFSAAGVTARQRTLQIWAHDTNNDTLLSNPVVINVP